MKQQGSSTRSVHSGVPRHKPNHAMTTSMTASATYAFENTRDLHDFMMSKVWGGGDESREEYGRYGNPTVYAVEQKLAALEGGESALLFASGMSAITTLLLASLSTGTHVIMTDDCYRRTRQFCEVFLKRLGIETTVVLVNDYDAMEAAIRLGQTRLIISESPTNPYLRVVDFERIAAIGQKYHVQTFIDSTFGTPINQKPLEAGIDYVVHSATKYLGGHHDLLAGVIIANHERTTALKGARDVLGGVLSPDSAYFLERGLRTLGLRVARQNENGMKLAAFLEQHPKIERVWYPGLASHPDHELAVRQMSGFGGVISLEVAGDGDQTRAFIDALTIPYIAPSFGGVESLIEQPSVMSFFDKEPEERLALGIKDNLVRFAAGVEDPEDLIADFEQALARI